ncbi:hypothetical protein H5410_003985 [Solanum commersonii]|uniref:Uncharacterized protein n=1 Tax=Solanum commersonii TaxID=4109 RepID=A0A9J6B6S5_SOLCO|nr:hypothetical protein H5410_003985 [Solanum commersonii]
MVLDLSVWVDSVHLLKQVVKVRKIDLEDDHALKMRTRKQSLKYIVEVLERRNKLSQIGNSTNEDSDLDVVIIEEESHPDVFIIAEEEKEEERMIMMKADRSKELTISTSYFDPGLESSNDAIQKKILEESMFLKFISPSLLDFDGFKVSNFSAAQNSPIYGEETVWDLIPQSGKATIFEFMWNNIVGDITLEKFIEPLSSSQTPSNQLEELSLCYAFHPQQQVEDTPITDPQRFDFPFVVHHFHSSSCFELLKQKSQIFLPIFILFGASPCE